MKKILIIFSIFFALTFFNSCTEYACTSGELIIGLKGFSDSEADTIIIRRFIKNTTSLKDTSLVNHIGFRRNFDTLEIVAMPGIIFPTTEFDYEFYFPESGKLFKISNIIEEQRSIKKKLGGTKEGCINNITSYTLNGQDVTTTGFSRTYLKK